MYREITLGDRGRGPQLSTSRITVTTWFLYLAQRMQAEAWADVRPSNSSSSPTIAILIPRTRSKL